MSQEQDPNQPPQPQPQPPQQTHPATPAPPPAPPVYTQPPPQQPLPEVRPATPPAPTTQQPYTQSYLPRDETGWKFRSLKMAVFALTFMMWIGGIFVTSFGVLSLVTMIYIPGLGWTQFYAWPLQFQFFIAALMFFLFAVIVVAWSIAWAYIYRPLHKGMTGKTFKRE